MHGHRRRHRSRKITDTAAHTKAAFVFLGFMVFLIAIVILIFDAVNSPRSELNYGLRNGLHLGLEDRFIP